MSPAPQPAVPLPRLGPAAGPPPLRHAPHRRARNPPPVGFPGSRPSPAGSPRVAGRCLPATCMAPPPARRFRPSAAEPHGPRPGGGISLILLATGASGSFRARLPYPSIPLSGPNAGLVLAATPFRRWGSAGIQTARAGRDKQQKTGALPGRPAATHRFVLATVQAGRGRRPAGGGALPSCPPRARSGRLVAAVPDPRRPGQIDQPLHGCRATTQALPGHPRRRGGRHHRQQAQGLLPPPPAPPSGPASGPATGTPPGTPSSAIPRPPEPTAPARRHPATAGPGRHHQPSLPGIAPAREHPETLALFPLALRTVPGPPVLRLEGAATAIALGKMPGAHGAPPCLVPQRCGTGAGRSGVCRVRPPPGQTRPAAPLRIRQP